MTLDPSDKRSSIDKKEQAYYNKLAKKNRKARALRRRDKLVLKDLERREKIGDLTVDQRDHLETLRNNYPTCSERIKRRLERGEDVEAGE